MAVYLLDTDTLSLFHHKHPAVVRSVSAYLAHTIAITTVTVEEQIRGWQNLAGQAKRPADHEFASQLLADNVALWATFPIYPLTVAALSHFDRLLSLKLNVGRMDLKIAAIALDLGATVVTRNRRDFARVPGLALADWSGGPQPAAPGPVPSP